MLFHCKYIVKILPQSNEITGSLFVTFRYPYHFTILVMPYHMLNYCHGVVRFIALLSNVSV